jgi:hypothetical protein
MGGGVAMAVGGGGGMQVGRGGQGMVRWLPLVRP